MSLATLLVLADGRFPAGGHAHSGGLEVAAASGAVHDLASLGAFLGGRLRTAGLVAAALAAASAAPGADLVWLDGETDARTPSPAQRAASRRLGRQLVRAARTAWPGAGWASVPVGPHHPVALGAATSAAGLPPSDAALVAASASVSGPATAAVRLLGLDPLAVTGVLADLAPAVDRVAEAAARSAAAGDLPALSAPLLDIGAEIHATWE
ncbi:MAG: urease accessory protein, partial [Actinomycetota bacterium]|nr:urease accessory protein [Actinomycetota bacterium]